MSFFDRVSYMTGLWRHRFIGPRSELGEAQLVSAGRQMRAMPAGETAATLSVHERCFFIYLYVIPSPHRMSCKVNCGLGSAASMLTLAQELSSRAIVRRLKRRAWIAWGSVRRCRRFASQAHRGV